jgi:hypothetical protein
MDTSTPTGRLNFNILASVAQFEREIMLTRQREGIDGERAAHQRLGLSMIGRSLFVRVSVVWRTNLEVSGMGALAKQKMTVDEFFVWAESHEGRYELIEGEAFAMSRSA